MKVGILNMFLIIFFYLFLFRIFLIFHLFLQKKCKHTAPKNCSDADKVVVFTFKFAISFYNMCWCHCNLQMCMWLLHMKTLCSCRDTGMFWLFFFTRGTIVKLTDRPLSPFVWPISLLIISWHRDFLEFRYRFDIYTRFEEMFKQKE